MEELERTARVPAKSGSSGNPYQLDPLIDALAQADAHGMLVFFNGAPVFHAVSIRVRAAEGEVKFQAQNFVTSDQLKEHGTDALAYMVQSLVQQVDYDRRKYRADRRI